MEESSYPKVKSPESGGDVFGINISYDMDDVDDWFKRCMSDRPVVKPAGRSKWTRGMTGDELMNAYPIYPTHKDWIKWFKKWFSQFQGSPTKVEEEED